MKKLLIKSAAAASLKEKIVEKRVERTVQEYLERSKDRYVISNMLMRDIINGKFTVNDVKNIIEKLSGHFYPEKFVDTDSFPTPKKPWSDKTLHYLEMVGLCGENSKEFFICLAEVSDYLRNR